MSEEHKSMGEKLKEGVHKLAVAAAIEPPTERELQEDITDARIKGDDSKVAKLKSRLASSHQDASTGPEVADA
ncbi:uncharacterized protein L969DRAFT_42899 [Mixia osmundae IAM 14324]|uniref:Uncharacterized protein n=1 Tax=Mixia osmundae (strain CBS 9802 / IAM 14324 / JCM 22182 / KY 12970) TaxID=764103 RepID=G7E322_MIXOS|nr:uncharacterized protein L969DRAFT_42899 [Mixia osmundae IAM 14324]KEI42508.1 hypothetical protein L969DRAFT_42899 [Mixia osmundae IAM 14324]GAA97203.1 hypothetical protein E5Q_03879 [Mixia osmundae IAM 14324]